MRESETPYGVDFVLEFWYTLAHLTWMRTNLAKALTLVKQYPSVEELVGAGVDIQRSVVDLDMLRGRNGRKQN